MITKKNKNIAKKNSGGPGKQARFGFPLFVFFALGAVVAFLAQFLVVAVSTGSWFTSRGKSNDPQTETVRKVEPDKRWGQLVSTKVLLNRPAESFPVIAPPRQAIRWFFKNYSRERLTSLVNACDLTAPQKAMLLEPARGEVRLDGYFLTPPLEAVRDMSALARKQLYSVLGQSAENHYQRNPFRYSPGQLEENLALSKLAPATIKLILKLTYLEGNSTCFGDSSLLEQLLSSEELALSARALSQTATFLLSLQVNSGTDIEALLKYWCRNGRGQALKPMLKSMVNVPGGTSISIVNFLPPFARVRLHTFPNPAVDHTPVPPDCFWTAMNFFNQEPDDRFFNPDHTRKVLATEYDRVSGEREFGDLILLHTADGFALHMCVYIEDDFVFTKNGAGPFQPWVFQKMSEMIAQYPSEKPLQLAVYRRKTAVN